MKPTVENLSVASFIDYIGRQLRSCIRIEQVEVVRDHFYDRVHKRFKDGDVEEACHVFTYLYGVTVNAVERNGGGR